MLRKMLIAALFVSGVAHAKSLDITFLKDDNVDTAILLSGVDGNPDSQGDGTRIFELQVMDPKEGSLVIKAVCTLGIACPDDRNFIYGDTYPIRFSSKHQIRITGRDGKDYLVIPMQMRRGPQDKQ